MLHCSYKPGQVPADLSMVRVPSLRKIQPVIEATRSLLAIDDSFETLTREDLYLVHSPEYVDGVLDGTIENGFGTKDVDLSRAALLSVSSFVAAATAALHCHIAFSPTQGFHHAHYNYGGGFCTFNGLVIAARLLLDRGLVQRVAIIDGDAHYGDGTDDCLRHQPEHIRRAILHLPAGSGSVYADYVRKDTSSISLAGICDATEDLMIQVETFDPDLVLYQPGADAHKDDSLGSGFLDSLRFKWRDRLLFSWLRFLQVPVCFNLAGGYQKDDIVVSLHVGTVCEASMSN